MLHVGIFIIPSCIVNSEHDQYMEKTAPDREESSNLEKYITVVVSLRASEL